MESVKVMYWLLALLVIMQEVILAECVKQLPLSGNNVDVSVLDQIESETNPPPPLYISDRTSTAVVDDNPITMPSFPPESPRNRRKLQRAGSPPLRRLPTCLPVC